MSEYSPPRRLRRGLQRSVRNNASAFAFSILITTTFGAVQITEGSPSVGELFLFALGATGAFSAAEIVASDFFRIRIEEEASETLLLGTALAPVTVTASLGVAIGVTQIVTSSWVAWLTTPFASSGMFVLLSGLNLALAGRRMEQNPPEEEE